MELSTKSGMGAKATDQQRGRSPILYINHGRYVLNEAINLGWKIGARYTNLRDTRHFGGPDFLDIDWKNYSFERHLEAAKITQPKLTIARDWTNDSDLTRILDEASRLSAYARTVAIVPKDPLSAESMERRVPNEFIFGYSVPTGYGETSIPTVAFKRPVHLLGGRPCAQLRLRNALDVISLDQNSFTIDARFGKHYQYFGYKRSDIGYAETLRLSLLNIRAAWGHPSPT